MATEELRDRLVREAGDLFYAEGINATGVLRIAEALRISKRTMYQLFATKDELVTATLAARDPQMRRVFVDAAEATGDDPAEQLVGLFSGVEPWLTAPGFRGCPFLNAAAELADRDHAAHEVCRDHKEQLRVWLEDRATAAGLRAPRAVSEQLMLLFDGTLSHAAVSPPVPGRPAAAARAIVDAAR